MWPWILRDIREKGGGLSIIQAAENSASGCDRPPAENPISLPTSTKRWYGGDASKIQGCDYHPSMQQIAWTETESGECGERRLIHISEAERFYRELKKKGVSVRVGMEATGHSR
jgi:hypothetical protein